MTRKKTKQCCFDGCNKSGLTVRTYYLCKSHYIQAKIFAALGDSNMEYVLKYSKHQSLTSQESRELKLFLANEC
jgi:hypothetical protein